MSSDPILDEEQKHLSSTYAKLEGIRETLAKELAALADEASEDIANMRDELAFDFAEVAHTFETYAEYELMNKVIDSYNLANDINAEKLKRTLLLLKRPYFAKVSLQFKPGSPIRDIYIGAAGMTDDDCRHFIIDWRSPIAEVYYNQQMGPTSYVADGRTITCDLKLRRQFDIDADKLNAYFDTTVAIEDPLLLASLTKRRSDKMSAITTTIQREQNTVIRHTDVPVLLVNGIAGSGKTSVLLQRIAYLFYTYRDMLDARNVCLITPNPVFQKYIDNVLPEMGERNPQTLTWAQLMERLGQGNAGLDGQVSVEDLQNIDTRLASFAFEPDDFCDIMLGKERVIGTGQVRSVAKRLAHHGATPRFCNLVSEELRDKLESRLASQAGSDAVHGEMMDLPEDEQVRIFGYRIFPQSEEEFRELAEKYLEIKYAPAFDGIEQASWLRLSRVGMRLLGKESLSPTEWVYLKLALTNDGNRDVRFVMVDEVQDYSLAQLMMLGRYYPNAHFLLLGDENQAVRPGTASFAELKALFARTHGEGQVDECRLVTSYRSSPEITALFASLVEGGQDIQAASVRSAGEKPEIAAFDKDDYEAALRDRLSQAAANAQENGGLAALICADRKSMRKVAALLGQEAPLALGDGAALPESGVVMMPLDLAKGLEFDQVIIPDADVTHYGDDRLSRRRLYTAISRATQRVTIMACEKLSPLLGA